MSARVATSEHRTPWMGSQAAPSSAPQEARSEKAASAGSALTRNKRLKILGSVSRGEEPGTQSAIKDELWVN